MATGVLSNVLNNSSPMFQYTPTGDLSSGFSQLGWQVNNTEDSLLYFTSRPGASVALSFFGTNVVLYGTATQPFSVVFDEQLSSSSTSSGGILFSSGNVPQDMHTVNLTVGETNTSDEEIVFEGASISAEYTINQTLPSGSVTYIPSPEDDTLVYTGNWTMNPNGTAQTSSVGSTVSLNFSGFSVAVNGPIGIHGVAGFYGVLLDQSNGSIGWTDPVSVSSTQLFYEAGLDATRNHTLDIVYIGGSPFAFDSIVVFRPGPSSTSSGSSGGHSKVVKIVVPIVACVAALLILAATLWVCKRQRQRRHTGALSGPFGARIARTFGRSGGDALPLNDLLPRADIKPVEDGQS
ncbi:hypothetical protein OBBRIDRAFT_839181 [Obba rivulosa]|uniref:Transmembrane protein n=1 Tax=Obba rivulosa TaxID=1052685 RepID=A0A8E2AJ35_9APHY|nr:hypothetical protein OBBRIDRAFT_839181 [Obba rivulosa]